MSREAQRLREMTDQAEAMERRLPFAEADPAYGDAALIRRDLNRLRVRIAGLRARLDG